MKVSVIVPVLNSEPQLLETLRSLAAVRDRLDLEILLVVDVPDLSLEPQARAENDQVAAEVDAIAVYRVGERGFGSALRRGFAEASGEAVVPIMGDASEDPNDVVRLTEELGKGWDIVAGSRYMSGGGIVGNTTKQRVSRFYSLLMRLAGGPPIHDVSNAFKAYGRSVVESIETVADSFDISVELTVKAHQAGFRITEIPTVWTNRKEGTSNFRPSRELRNYGRWLVLAASHRRRAPAADAELRRPPPSQEAP
jgi:glycosyltransferase involved in cell wall biosynthesis